MKKRMFKITALILSAVLLVTGTFYFTLAYLQAKSNPVVNTFTAGKINLTLKESEVDEYGNVLYYTAGSFDAEGKLTENAESSTTKTVIVEGQEAPAIVYDKVNLVEENNYKLVPDAVYTKDPVVTVEAGSEPCFLYIAVYNGLDERNNQIYEVEDEDAVVRDLEASSGDNGYKTIADQLSDNGWELLPDASWVTAPHGGNFDVYYHYHDGSYVVDALTEAKEFDTFKQFKVSKDAIDFEIKALATEYETDLNGNKNVAEDDTYGSVNTIEVYAFAVQSANFDNDARITIYDVTMAWSNAFGQS